MIQRPQWRRNFVRNRSNNFNSPKNKMIPRPSSIRETDVPVNYSAKQPSGCSRCLASIQHFIVGGMERFFYNYGKSVATHPFLYILLCVVITVGCGAGLMRFRQENTGIKLWIPEDSSQRQVLASQTWHLWHFRHWIIIKSNSTRSQEIKIIQT